jgi:hypothetical protein
MDPDEYDDVEYSGFESYTPSNRWDRYYENQNKVTNDSVVNTSARKKPARKVSKNETNTRGKQKVLVEPERKVNIVDMTTGVIVGNIVVPAAYKDPIPDMELGIDLTEIFEEVELPWHNEGIIDPM